MTRLALALLMWPILLAAQQEGALPLIIGRPVFILPPAVDGAGRTAVFGSAVTPEGAVLPVVNLYTAGTDGSGIRRLTQLPGGLVPPQGANAVSVSPSGARAVYSMLPSDRSPGEEVHVVEVSSATDRIVAVYTEGCIQPLEAACPNCFFACVYSPHISPDAGKVLYAVRRNNPFFAVNADGTGLSRLPVYSGSLAPAPQRVISRTGLVVFTSSAPFGPTFAAAAQDVYVMNLDGSSIRAVTQFGNDSTLYATNAVISADGRTVAFESNRDPDTGKAGRLNHIWAVNSDGTGLRPLTFNVVCAALNCPQPGGNAPTISGDGSMVAFVNGDRIWLARSDGGSGKALAAFKMSAASNPVFSDDGSRVVFTAGPRNGGAGAVYAVNSDGSNLRLVFGPRAINPNGVTSAAAGSQPSPGSLVTAYGINLAADELVSAARFPLPEALAGVSLLVNGRAAPLLAITPWQANAQLPPETGEGPAAFQLRFTDGTLSVASAAEVKSYAPAIFSFDAARTVQAAVFHGNSGIPADEAHPAAAGEVVEMYGTGLGPTNPLVAAGLAAPASPLARTLVIPEVLIGNVPAQVVFSGLTPGFAGVYQVNAVVPAGLRPGQQVVRWRVGNNTSASFGTISVK